MREAVEYDWEVREDATILKCYQEIKSDPERMSRAKGYIAHTVKLDNAVLNDEPYNEGKNRKVTFNQAIDKCRR